MIYGLLACVLPVWLLLAPRDYLSTFTRIGTVASLGIAIVAIAPPMQMPALTRFIDGTGPVFAGPVFPFCLIAACAMPPGEYFAINMKGQPAAVVQQVNSLGFAITEQQMSDLAANMGENTMIGRTGGAPTFAVGMANMFASALGSKAALSLWYHFAIMFEALVILTTIDAGTRVGRFLVQDLLGYVWKPLGRTDLAVGNWLASLFFVAVWGYFLYQGVVDPLGGINSLWPIFGVANQLLAVIALSLGVTVLLKMGRARYVGVALLPLAWLLNFTVTAGWMKIFSADPRLGFLSAAADFHAKLSSGTAAQTNAWQHQILNQVNAVGTGTFLLLVITIVAACVREWWRLLAEKEIRPLREEPYVALPAA